MNETIGAEAVRRVVLARRPVGVPASADFRIEDAAEIQLREGECALANAYLSIDPAIRGFLDDRPSYLPPVALGETVRAMSLGRVVRSHSKAFIEGTYLRALTGWEDISRLSADALGLEQVMPDAGIDLAHYLGALGPTGLTAWIGLHEIGRIRPGQTVLISAAAGAVGNVAGQLARSHGCRAVGLAGSDEKTQRLREIGFHGAINYRSANDLRAAIGVECPDGIDVYFDNVGANILETVLPLMNVHGTVVVCGMIGDYNDQDHPHPVRTLWQLVVKRLTLRGFLTYEHAERLPQAREELLSAVRSGALRPLINVRKGLERAPEAFIDLMSGRTMGKTLVELEPERFFAR